MRASPLILQVLLDPAQLDIIAEDPSAFESYLDPESKPELNPPVVMTSSDEDKSTKREDNPPHKKRSLKTSASCPTEMRLHATRDKPKSHLPPPNPNNAAFVTAIAIHMPSAYSSPILSRLLTIESLSPPLHKSQYSNKHHKKEDPKSGSGGGGTSSNAKDGKKTKHERRMSSISSSQTQACSSRPRTSTSSSSSQASSPQLELPLSKVNKMGAQMTRPASSPSLLRRSVSASATFDPHQPYYHIVAGGPSPPTSPKGTTTVISSFARFWSHIDFNFGKRQEKFDVYHLPPHLKEELKHIYVY